MSVDHVEPTLRSIPSMNASSARVAQCKCPEALTEPNKASAKNEHIDRDDTNRETDDSGRARGVIHHLEQGHFKGVADVRLRSISLMNSPAEPALPRLQRFLRAPANLSRVLFPAAKDFLMN